MAKIDHSYHKLLNKILNEGFKYEDPNRKNIFRYQIPSYQITHDFKDGFPAITTKNLYWKGIVGELLWFLRGDTNIKYLVDNNINIWNKDAYNYYLKEYLPENGTATFEEFIALIKQNEKLVYHELGNLGRVYGAQWRKWTKNNDPVGGYRTLIDQISNTIKELRYNPMGTKHIVTAWNPAELDDMALPPCHWSFEILVEPLTWGERNKYVQPHHGNTIDSYRNGGYDFFDKIKAPKYQFTLKWHQRSVDTFLGLPFNIASYALLAQIIGKMTNMIPKGIVGDLSNVHIYKPHLDAVKEQLSRDVDKHGISRLGVDFAHTINLNKDVDHICNSFKISNFELLNYTSYPAIKAEMLPYNK